MNHVASTADQISITPMTPSIGAEIGNVDLREPLTEAVRGRLYQALLEWKVIFFRDQDITTEQHLAFAASFGELEIHPFAKQHPDYPEVLPITHDADHPGAENAWHSDVTWRQQPSLGSVLRLREVPPVGGDTLFADMEAAYRGLPEEVREKVEGKYALHDFEVFRRRRKAAGATEEELAEFDRLYPNPEHPVIRTHPDTGRQSIYVNVGFTRRILGMDEAESERLLKFLFAQANHPEYQCRFRWEKNSIAFWDNRACQHYATSDYWPHRRVAERVTIVGDTPYYKSSGEAFPGLDENIRGTVRRLATGTMGPRINLGAERR